MAYLFNTNNNESIHNSSISYNMTNSSDVMFTNASFSDTNRTDYDATINVIYYFNITERVLSFGGILLNLATVIILMSRNGSLKTQLKLIMSLAISDCLIALFHFVLTFYNFPNVWKLFRNYFATLRQKPNILKTVLSFIYTATQYAGLGTMCAISVDILIKVQKPLRYKMLMSKRRGNIVVTCLWLIPCFLILCLVAVAIYFADVIFHVTFLFILASIFYCVLCLLFFFIFLIIYIIILCSVNSFMHRLPSRSRHSITKTAVTFFLIIATYFICILPSILLFLLSLTDVVSSYSDLVLIMTIISCLYILNTVLDPIIYAIRIPEVNIRYKLLYRRLYRFVRPKGITVNISNM